MAAGRDQRGETTVINLQRLFPTAGKWHNSAAEMAGSMEIIEQKYLWSEAPAGSLLVQGEGLRLPRLREQRWLSPMPQELEVAPAGTEFLSSL